MFYNIMSAMPSTNFSISTGSNFPIFIQRKIYNNSQRCSQPISSFEKEINFSGLKLKSIFIFLLRFADKGGTQGRVSPQAGKSKSTLLAPLQAGLGVCCQ
jgi:hypothetical protein